MENERGGGKMRRPGRRRGRITRSNYLFLLRSASLCLPSTHLGVSLCVPVSRRREDDDDDGREAEADGENDDDDGGRRGSFAVHRRWSALLSPLFFLFFFFAYYNLQ